MDDVRLGRLVRVLRHRKGWRQVDLAGRAGVTRTAVSELELGRIERMRLASTRRVLAAFGLSVEVGLRGRAADAERLLDERHARLVGAIARWLIGLGWQTRTEVSYSEWGERGSIDLLARHPPSETLLVIEVKTELVSVEQTLRKHDEKTRLAAVVVERRFGWQPTVVARLLVLPTDRTQRRRVADHAGVLDGAYPARTRRVRAWCRWPVGDLSGLMFVPDVANHGVNVGRRRRERVRVPD